MELIIDENRYLIENCRKCIQVSRGNGVIKQLELKFKIFPFSLEELKNLLDENDNNFMIKSEDKIEKFKLSYSGSFQLDGENKILNILIQSLV